MRAGAVVLAGGRSSRMGRAKALLQWGGGTAVEHAVAVVREGGGGGPVCVVRAPGQELPPLEAIVVDDPVAHAGPLAALSMGLESIAASCDVAFACGVDTPLLTPAFVCAVTAAVRDGDDAALPVVGGRDQPLLAAYRVSLVQQSARLLAAGATGLRDLIAAVDVRRLSESDLEAVDPARAARNANTPEEWAALRSLC